MHGILHFVCAYNNSEVVQLILLFLLNVEPTTSSSPPKRSRVDFRGMYVCMYVCICVYVRTYVRTYVRNYVCMYVCVCVCTGIYVVPL